MSETPRYTIDSQCLENALTRIVEECGVALDQQASTGWLVGRIQWIAAQAGVRLGWRSEPPIEPGWYWLKQDGYDVEPVEFTHGGYVLFSGRLTRFRPSDLNASARWFGPIEAPKPPAVQR